ncbi:non-structural maintenance of chromosomes element 1 [Dorcoceras hygrometricum]|uniref:Non-structural maintenance of chromosomes element 1 homolog n=1 Tax=Dorcoceras hygrometricum TaxID=472368 RepID=A0A2Z7D9Q9_9LAMI|nr:non-structural maintenance of chromosomes element 1 [Dorcoceras hygrometricum]
MSALSWRHHTLIQAVLSRGPIKEDDFRSIFSHVSGKPSGTQKQQQQQFNEYLRKINAELNYVQFELRACRNQYDGDVYYGVVNSVSDDQSKLGTKYTVPQITFYKGIVEAIIQDAEATGTISNIDALNTRLDAQLQGGAVQIPPALKNFSMSQKEKTLEQLVNDQWLSSTAEGKIGLGVRSFLDLRSWFRSNEVPACEVCNEAAVKAELCLNEACNVRLHRYCLQKKFSQQRIENVCPGCGTKWPGFIFKPESVEEGDLPHVPSQNSQHAESSMRKRQRSRLEADADVTGSESCQTLSGHSDAKRMTRRSTRLTAS